MTDVEELDVLDEEARVVRYRPIPGFPDYVMGTDRSVRNIRLRYDVSHGHVKAKGGGKFIMLFRDGEYHYLLVSETYFLTYPEHAVMSDLSSVEWRPIPEFPIYEICKEGAVRRIDNQREVTQFFNGFSLVVRLSKDGVYSTRTVRKMIEPIFADQLKRR